MNTNDRINALALITGRHINAEILDILDENFGYDVLIDFNSTDIPTAWKRPLLEQVLYFVDGYHNERYDRIYNEVAERRRVREYTHNENHYNVCKRLAYEYCDHAETWEDHDAMVDYFDYAINEMG